MGSMKKIGSLKKNQLLPLAVVALTLLALVAYTFFCLNHLMHSDMAAEVLLSRLLADRGELITKEWYYSTEIRILYSQLVMTPLFYLFSDYHTVKVLCILIYLAAFVLTVRFLTARFQLSPAAGCMVLMLLLSPWSNEYLDMMFLGNFYTSQVIIMFLVTGLFWKQDWKSPAGQKAALVFLGVLAVLCGLSGLRYPACLFVPLVLATATGFLADMPAEENAIWWRKLPDRFLPAVALTICAGAGFLIHKFYLAPNYSFDQTPVTFVPLSEVPDRLLVAFKLMLELFGYREGVSFASGLGLCNVIKCLAFLVYIISIVRLFYRRKELLKKEEIVFLWYFVFLFLINLYMLVFTNVLQQYRYWIPVFAVGTIPVAFYWERGFGKGGSRTLVQAFLVLAALSSLYGELWQDVKFDDCAKREGYMAFLENSDYDFGYATFWNGPVTEYLSNGRVKMGNIGENGPYEWLTPKAYYRKGFHQGKVFMLLAVTEEKGLLETDAPVMEDSRKVYGDEYYSIYEKDEMFLFSEK